MQSTAASMILALAIATAALAGSQEEQRRLTPSDIAVIAKSGAGAGTSGVSGIQTTVLSGDPTAAVVISGVWFFGYGSSADETEVKALEPGSFYTEPADAPHFAMTRDEPATVYITGFGPTDTHYIDATADPRRP
jgi:hypothetical protein